MRVFDIFAALSCRKPLETPSFCRQRWCKEAQVMHVLAFSATVAIGSLIGTMIATPHEDQLVILTFVIFNAAVSLLGAALVSGFHSLFRSMGAPNR
jgi:hypothetical protein